MAEVALLRHRPWAAGSAVLGVAMLALYVGVIVSEGNNTFFSILPWALLMAIAPALSFSAVLAKDPRVARSLLIAAAALYGGLGLLSVFTIGIGFLLTAVVAALGASKA